MKKTKIFHTIVMAAFIVMNIILTYTAVVKGDSIRAALSGIGIGTSTMCFLYLILEK